MSVFSGRLDAGPSGIRISIENRSKFWGERFLMCVKENTRSTYVGQSENTNDGIWRGGKEEADVVLGKTANVY